MRSSTRSKLFPLGDNANALTFEIVEAAVIEVFGTRELPKHVRIIVASRRQRRGT